MSALSALPPRLTVAACELFFLPCTMRVPLKFGAETVDSLLTARVSLQIADGQGRQATGWGETPLSAAWAWPSPASFGERQTAMQEFCDCLAEAWRAVSGSGHALEIGYDFLEEQLPALLRAFNAGRVHPMPHLAALICTSAFDLALHDAFGKLVDKPVYQTYNSTYMQRDLQAFFDDADFSGQYPEDYLLREPARELPVWHLVGGKDVLEAAELTGSEPQDGYPVTLTGWIERDGLFCLKIKLTGSDAAWDYARMVQVGEIALRMGCTALSPDFNCLVKDPAYVNVLLDRLAAEHPEIYDLILYVEQPFPYDLEANRIDVHSVSQRKLLFMDESAHDWRLVKLGHALGWTGVALKVCKTQTGALLSACWARAHGMELMVQDLTNPRLALIPHVLLAAHVGTIMGIECNACQFYPEASRDEAAIHPGLYERRGGRLRLETLAGNGFGYNLPKLG